MTVEAGDVRLARQRPSTDGVESGSGGLTGEASVGLRSWRQLAGFSGCRVLSAVSTSGLPLVRKIATTPASSARLREQARRQIAVASEIPAGTAVPEVLADGLAGGLYWFDMEHVHGVDGATYLADCTLADVRRLADQLVSLLGTLAALPSLDVAEPTERREPPSEKLRSRVQSAGRTDPLLDTKSVDELLLAVAPILDRQSATACHGDLTLENLMVDRHRTVWLIDFLDPPFEHIWSDVAKVHQDLAGRWSYHRSGIRLSAAVAAYTSAALMEAAGSIDDDYAIAHHALLAANFCRIIPYATTPSDRSYVRTCVDQAVESARRGRSTGWSGGFGAAQTTRGTYS